MRMYHGVTIMHGQGQATSVLFSKHHAFTVVALTRFTIAYNANLHRGSFALPDGKEWIPMRAFKDRTSLKHIDIPNPTTKPQVI